MDGIFKKIIFVIITIASLIIIGYGAYVLYQVVISDATSRIKTGVSEGVSEGVTSGVGGMLNPVKMIGGVFGGGKK